MAEELTDTQMIKADEKTPCLNTVLIGLPSLFYLLHVLPHALFHVLFLCQPCVIQQKAAHR